MVKSKSRHLKRAVTLIEMIVVMILIAMITGAVAYNYRGSLNEGRCFKTQEAISRIETIITLYLADNPEAKNGSSSDWWHTVVKQSPFVNNSKDLLNDAWGKPLKVEINTNDSTGTGKLVTVSSISPEYQDYLRRKGLTHNQQQK